MYAQHMLGWKEDNSGPSGALLLRSMDDGQQASKICGDNLPLIVRLLLWRIHRSRCKGVFSDQKLIWIASDKP